MANFDDAALEREARRLAPIIRRNLDAVIRSLSERQLVDVIVDALRGATDLAIVDHGSRVSFVILALLLGRNFTEHPKVKVLIDAPDAGIETKIQTLLSEVQWHLRRAEGVL